MEPLFKAAKLSLLILLLLILMQPPTWARERLLRMNSGAEAIEYLPPDMDYKKKYPLLIALHGMGQKSSEILKIWRPVASEMGYILLCIQGSNFEQGYTRSPRDDRQNIYNFSKRMEKRFRIDKNKSILAGFSRGGNFAIEMGLRYPEEFRNIVCIFGFFNNNLHPLANQNAALKKYRNSRFYFITGSGDQTEKSLTMGYRTLAQNSLRVRLRIYPNLYHEYPPDLVNSWRKIRSWMFN